MAEANNKNQDLAQKSRTTVELRKNKQKEELCKRENIDASIVDGLTKEDLKFLLMQLQTEAQSDSVEEKLQAIRTVRIILSKCRKPPIDDVIDSEILPILVHSLGYEDESIQLEAAWVMTNIASGNSEQTNQVVESGAVPILVKMLDSKFPTVQEQVMWALSNIAGNGPRCKDLVISHGIIPTLVKFVQTHPEVSFIRNVAWTLSNLCRHKHSPPSLESARQIVPALMILVQHEDIQVKIDTCWSLCFLAGGTSHLIQVVVDSNIIPKVILLLDSDNDKLLFPAIRTMCNILGGSDEQAQKILDEGLLPYLLKLISHRNTYIVKETVWALSNISAGNQHQIQMMIEADLIPPLIDTLCHGDFKIRKEAAYAVSNISLVGRKQQVSYLVNHGAIPGMCRFIDSHDVHTVRVILDGLEHILRSAGANSDVIATKIEECGGLDKLEKHLEHENNEIYKLACTIVENYFSSSNDESLH